MKKINKRTLKRVIQEEVASIQQEGIFDWFKKKEEPTTGETDEEFDAANAQSQADQDTRDTEEIERVKEEILATASSFGEYLPDVYDFANGGRCREDSEDCKGFEHDYSNALGEFLILNSGPLHGGEVRKKVVEFYEQAINSRHNRMSLQHLQDLQSHLEKNLEKVLDQRDSSSMSAAAGRERVRNSQERDDESEWRGGDLRRRNRERTPGGGFGLTRENKRLSKRKLQRIINEEIQKLLGSRG